MRRHPRYKLTKLFCDAVRDKNSQGIFRGNYRNKSLQNIFCDAVRDKNSQGIFRGNQPQQKHSNENW